MPVSKIIFFVSKLILLPSKLSKLTITSSSRRRSIELIPCHHLSQIFYPIVQRLLFWVDFFLMIFWFLVLEFPWLIRPSILEFRGRSFTEFDGRSFYQNSTSGLIGLEWTALLSDFHERPIFRIPPTNLFEDGFIKVPWTVFVEL